MSENQLVPKKSVFPAVFKKAEEETHLAIVNYEKIDSAHYSFSYRFDDDVEFRMDESDQAADATDFIEAEFDEGVEESAKIYYSVAAASGILTGAISMLHFTEEQLKAIDTFKEKDWKPIVVSVANLIGYKKNDYKGAAKYLVTRAVRTIEKNEKTKETLAILSEHPSLAGLVFSVIAQFSGKAVCVNENGVISKHKLPDYYTVGETNAEKIVCAVLYWLFALAADEAISKRRVLDEIGISAALLKKIKEFANFPFMKKIPSDYEEAEKAFSIWLKNTITGAELYSESEEHEGKTNPLFALMGIALNLAEDSFPVLINECIVRGLFVLLRICTEVKERKITSFEELMDIPAASVLPESGHVLSRMCLIASASFAAANIAGATLKAVKDKKTKGRKFSETFFAELNIAGIGRFLFACVSDSKYWGEDIRILLQRNGKSKQTHTQHEYEPFEENDAFKPLSLNAVQTCLLYCLENILVQYDISHTQKPEVAENKALWLSRWKELLLRGFGIPSDQADKLFVEDEDVLFNGFFQLSQDKSNWGWFYLLTQELALFKPYYPLGCPEDKLFKKLKQESDYVEDRFIRRQTIVSQAEVDAIVKTYSKYDGYVSGSTKNKIIGASATAVVAVATGGMALTFAPGIAAAIAGEAVVGLHGAALTSASLAFVGGGSLAAGGLGMAGGTAIITGGGALLGLAGSGSVSAATMMLQAPSEYWVRQGAKLLTYSKCVLCDYLNEKQYAKGLLHQIEFAISDTEDEIKSLKTESNDLDKEILKKTEEYLKYLKRCQSELQRLTKD